MSKRTIKHLMKAAIENIKPVYVGLSPSTGKQLYVMPGDEVGSYSYYGAIGHVRALNLNYRPFGFIDWRLPTIEELRVLFTLRAVIGCDETNAYLSGSPRIDLDVYHKEFSDGSDVRVLKDTKAKLRCVRSGGPKFGTAVLTARRW